MTYNLELEIDNVEFGIGMYGRPRAYLTDTANEDFKEEIEATITTSGSIGFILDSTIGFPLFVATANGVGAILSEANVGGSTLSDSVSVSVSANYDWGISDNGDIPTPSGQMENVPFARYSGQNKGVNRPFDSKEDTIVTTSMQTMSIPSAGKLDMLNPMIVASQSFDVTAVEDGSPTGWGFTPFGT